MLSDDDIEKLATITPYATGATIKDMVNEALITAIRDGRRVITWADIIKAKQLKEHGLADDFDYVRARAPRPGHPRGLPRGGPAPGQPATA